MSVNLSNLLFPIVLSNGSCQLEPIHREKKYCLSPLTVFTSLLTSKNVQKKISEVPGIPTQKMLLSVKSSQNPQSSHVCGSKSHTHRMKEY